MGRYQLTWSGDGRSSSGLTHINDKYAKADNAVRVAGPFAEPNFGLVEIDWSSNPTQVTLAAVGGDGSVGFSYRVSLDVLRLRSR